MVLKPKPKKQWEPPGGSAVARGGVPTKGGVKAFKKARASKSISGTYAKRIAAGAAARKQEHITDQMEAYYIISILNFHITQLGKIGEA